MKFIKTFAILAILFAANTLTAQAVASKWPAMKSFEEVITRINNGVEQNNLGVISSFTGTLQSFSQRLTTEEIPTAYKNNQKLQAAITKMQGQTNKLNELVIAKAPEASLKTAYLETYATFEQVRKHLKETK